MQDGFLLHQDFLLHCLAPRPGLRTVGAEDVKREEATENPRATKTHLHEKTLPPFSTRCSAVAIGFSVARGEYGALVLAVSANNSLFDHQRRSTSQTRVQPLAVQRNSHTRERERE
jgi:hypothetical protein